MEFLYCPSKHYFEFWPYILHIKILISSFQRLEFWIILILALLVQTLEFLLCKCQECFRLPLKYFYVRRILVIFVFAPLVLFFVSLVFHRPRRFVLRVRVFLHIVYLAFIVIFASVLC